MLTFDERDRGRLACTGGLKASISRSIVTTAMRLHIQDPDSDSGTYLLEEILDISGGATRGGGIFSFASRNGVDLLLLDPVFNEFGKIGKFELVVGVDAVTDARALRAISAIVRKQPNITARAFFHERHGILFHPKLCWFAGARTGVLLVGSGNLTGGGLRDNWEASAVVKLTRAELASVETQWNAWLSSHDANLLALDDPRVVERASRNLGWTANAGRRPARTARTRPAADSLPAAATEADVLVAEIPGGPAGRWEQANFDLKTFTEFFGASPEKPVRIFLQHVDSNGALGEVELRPSVAVKSSNYRFELKAAKGLPYPKLTAGRPIGVFVKVAARRFRYGLLMPGKPDHAALAAFLTGAWKGRADRMRRCRVSSIALRSQWSNPKFWKGVTEIAPPATP
ncbi:MAG: phospholipase D family protein [Chloroflexota bacterium]|nr:phospholipase D family protein [Chloroflexota bacterium]